MGKHTIERSRAMKECYSCGFWDSDIEGCTCPSTDMWYACPIESSKPENQEALLEYAKDIERKGAE